MPIANTLARMQHTGALRAHRTGGAALTTARISQVGRGLRKADGLTLLYLLTSVGRLVASMLISEMVRGA